MRETVEGGIVVHFFPLQISLLLGLLEDKRNPPILLLCYFPIAVIYCG